MIKRDELPTCPVEVTLTLMDNRWKTLILRDLLTGTKRFSQLKKSLCGISQKVLTQNLRAMEANGIVSREIFAEVPPRVEYSLTKTGHSLSPVLHILAQWGDAYRQTMPEDGGIDV